MPINVEHCCTPQFQVNKFPINISFSALKRAERKIKSHNAIKNLNFKTPEENRLDGAFGIEQYQHLKANYGLEKNV